MGLFDSLKNLFASSDQTTQDAPMEEAAPAADTPAESHACTVCGSTTGCEHMSKMTEGSESTEEEPSEAAEEESAE